MSETTVHQKWEYERQDFHGQLLPRAWLDGFGHRGWELVSAQVISDPVSEIGGTYHYFVVFKRPKQTT